ncbi:MAG: AAA family ATPase [Xanthobacteraceae bacterium]|nr:AAA family ATPase [Xanthobacteraceae bacterium]
MPLGKWMATMQEHTDYAYEEEYDVDILVSESDGQICLAFIAEPLPRDESPRAARVTLSLEQQPDQDTPTTPVLPPGPRTAIFDFRQLLFLLKEGGVTCVGGWNAALDAHAALARRQFDHPPAAQIAQEVKETDAGTDSARGPDAGAPEPSTSDTLSLDDASPSSGISEAPDLGGRVGGDGIAVPSASRPAGASRWPAADAEHLRDGSTQRDASDGCWQVDSAGVARPQGPDGFTRPASLWPAQPERPQALPSIYLDADTLPDNEANRLHRLMALYHDERLNLRPLLVANQDMVVRIEGLRMTLAGSLHPLLDIVSGAASLSMRTGTALRMPPLLLVGPPGCGKTHATEALAAALAVPITRISAPTMTDSGMWLGHPVSWKTPKTGQLTAAVIAHGASICLIDEIDKVYHHDSSDSPLDPLLGLLERGSSTRVKDEFLELEVDHSQTMFVACANDLGSLSAPLLDRFLIVRVSAPDKTQSLLVARGMMAERLSAFGGAVRTPDEAVIIRLASFHPRRLGRVLDLALGAMARAGRRQLDIADIEAVEPLFDHEQKAEVGFPRRSIG